MKEREPVVVTGLVLLLLVAWLGFTVHTSPRFAGSLVGGLLALSGTGLMLVPLTYSVIKRVPTLRRWTTRVVSMSTLLTWHIYAGVLGPILVLLHTGHKFESHLGIALTAMTLVVVLSGFVGRYLLGYIGTELHEKQTMLVSLRAAYAFTGEKLGNSPESPWRRLFQHGGVAQWVAARWLSHKNPEQLSLPPQFRAVRLSSAIADVEYAIRTHETFKRAFRIWLKTHLVLSYTLYTLIALHVWASIHFGLRWLQ